MKLCLALGALAAAAAVAGAAQAADPKFILATPDAFIAQGVVVPAGYETFYVAGVPGDVAKGGTEGQTADILVRIGELLKSQGYSFKDVVNVRVYLLADPAKGGKMDFDGMNTAFKKVFGAEGEPNKPARVTAQVVALNKPGALVEFEMVAVKRPKAAAKKK